MPRLIVLVPNEATGLPPIYDAAFCLHKARTLGCDRIRVERLDGALVTEYPIQTVEAFIARYHFALQPGRRTVPGEDWERHRPVWPSSGLTRSE
jgi:hypothetical protein